MKPGEFFREHSAKTPLYIVIDAYAFTSTSFAQMIKDAENLGLKKLKVNDHDYTAKTMKGYWLVADAAKPEPLIMFYLKYRQYLLRELTVVEMGKYMDDYTKHRKIYCNIHKRFHLNEKNIMDFMYFMGKWVRRQSNT